MTVQSLVPGSIKTAISVNAVTALSAGAITLFLSTRPSRLLIQRYLMGTVLAGLAVRMALQTRGNDAVVPAFAGDDRRSRRRQVVIASEAKQSSISAEAVWIASALCASQ